jgi:putative membrane protein
MSLMEIRWALGALHLLALPIGFAAIALRAIALRHAASGTALRSVFVADSVWGLSALLWISTGLVRTFGYFEKGSQYYLGNSWFWVKIGLLAVILALEVLPMVTLIRWRLEDRKGKAVDLSRAGALSLVSVAQALLILAMVVVAAGMARGLGT